MSLSATQLLKLEGAKMGLRQTNSKFATPSSEQGRANDDHSPVSSDSASPTGSSGAQAATKQQEQLEVDPVGVHELTADMAGRSSLDANSSPVRAEEPGAAALSGMLFRHMNVWPQAMNCLI